MLRKILDTNYFALHAAKEGGATITFTNKCPYTVWPATIGLDSSNLTTGFELVTGATNTVDVPSPWRGRFWARTGCSGKSGKFTCATGDCASGEVECKGSGGNPPATLLELSIASTNGLDYYDVSNVDGFNLPVSIAPEGGNGNCKSSSCPADINSACPTELQVKGSDGNVIACKNACMAFVQDQYCCIGNFSTPEKCPRTRYSNFFGKQCPEAYSYPYDDRNAGFTCSGGPNYIITFCP